jgi:hypothetical protein
MVEPTEVCSGGDDVGWLDHERYGFEGVDDVHRPPVDDPYAELPALVTDDPDEDDLPDPAYMEDDEAVTETDTGEVPIVECERPAHADGHHGPECHDWEAETDG